MGYVQFILDRRKQAQAAVPSAPNTLLDLPGFKRREGLIADEEGRAKAEYNRSVKDLRTLSKAVSSAKGDRKKELRARITSLKGHMDHLLRLVGPYTADEKVYGFKEDGHGF